MSRVSPDRPCSASFGSTVLQEEAGQVQPGPPAFGVAEQQVEFARGQVQTVRLYQQRMRFGAIEGELARADFAHRVAGPVACDRKPGDRAAGDDHVQARGRTFYQAVDQVVELRRLGQVVVVEEQDTVFLEPVEVVGDAEGDFVLVHRGGTAFHEALRGQGNDRPRAVETGDQVAEEDERVLVVAVERQPHRLVAHEFVTLRDQRGLAEAGSGRHQHHLRQFAHQPRGQSGPVDRIGELRGRTQLRGQDVRCARRHGHSFSGAPLVWREATTRCRATACRRRDPFPMKRPT